MYFYIKFNGLLGKKNHEKRESIFNYFNNDIVTFFHRNGNDFNL